MFTSTSTSTGISPRATALGLAAVCTVAILGSINMLASQPATDTLMAARSAPHQVVVITAKRLQA